MHLLHSRILNYEFDFEEWPSMHTNDETILRPYNESIFDLRLAYDKIFTEPELADPDANGAGGEDGDSSSDDAKDKIL